MSELEVRSSTHEAQVRAINAWGLADLLVSVACQSWAWNEGKVVGDRMISSGAFIFNRLYFVIYGVLSIWAHDLPVEHLALFTSSKPTDSMLNSLSLWSFFESFRLLFLIRDTNAFIPYSKSAAAVACRSAAAGMGIERQTHDDMMGIP